MAISLTDKDPEHATAGNSEASMQSDISKGNEAEMKDPELDVQAAKTLDPTSNESANKGGENEATPESSLSAPQPISTDDSPPSLASISSPSPSSSSPPRPPQPPQTPASTTSNTNAKVAKAFDEPRLPSAFKSQRPPEPRTAKKKITYIDFSRPATTPRRAPPRAPSPSLAPTPTPAPAPVPGLIPAYIPTPAPTTLSAPAPPGVPSDPAASMVIDTPFPITLTPALVAPRSSAPISVPSASTVVPLITSGNPVTAVAGSAASEALNAFNSFPSTAGSTAATNPVASVPAIPVSPVPSFQHSPIPAPPFPVFAIAGTPASESLNISSFSPSYAYANGLTSLSPSPLAPLNQTMTGTHSPPPTAPPPPSSSQNHTTSTSTPSTKGKGKARVPDENRADWRAAVEFSRESGTPDANTAAVWAAMREIKTAHEEVQRHQISSVYHSQSGEAYESMASSSSSSVNGNGEGLHTEAMVLIQEAIVDSSEKAPRPSRSRLSIPKKAKKNLPPIPEQGEENAQDVKDRGAAGVPTPEIKVTPPEDESMMESLSAELRPAANAPAPVQTPEVIGTGLSIRGAAKALSPSGSVEMEDGEVDSHPLTLQPAILPPGIAIPQLGALVPALTPIAEEQEGVQPANFSPPSITAALPSPQPATSFATSAASFGLRTSPKQSPPPGLNQWRSLSGPEDMEEDEESTAHPFSGGPTPDRQYNPDLSTEGANLPPLPSFFGVRTFSSTMTPEPEANSSLPPTEEEDKMEEDTLPLLDRVVPSGSATSLLSRIGARKTGVFSAPLSLVNAPPLGDASEPTLSLANAPPLASTSAFSSSFSFFGSAPALGLYTSQQDASSKAPTAASAPAHWPKWGDWGAAWGCSAQTSASTLPTQIQPPLPTSGSQTQTACTPTPSLSPLELANAFWTSTSAKVGGDSFAPEEPKPLAQDDSSSPEPDYDSDDSSASSFWDSASDGEDDFNRSVRANGILTPPRVAPVRSDRFGVPSRQSSIGAPRVVPHIVLTLTLLGLKRDRYESDDSSDSSEDEDVFICGKRQRRRYRAPGDTFVREQFRTTLKARAKRSPSITSSSLPSSPSFSPLILPLKALPLPPTKREVSSLDDIDPTMDLFSDDLFWTELH